MNSHFQSKLIVDPGCRNQTPVTAESVTRDCHSYTVGKIYLASVYIKIHLLYAMQYVKYIINLYSFIALK